MAVHSSLESLIRESLPEYLLVAEYCVKFRKGSTLQARQAGGCLGYPAAVMLFSIADAIGSFYKDGTGNRKDLHISIGGRPRFITKDGFQHFFILNSEYYGQALDEPMIKKLYDNFRHLLIHNASLPPNSFLRNLPSLHEAFPQADGHLMVDVPAFYDISKGAVQHFLARIDDVVPGSKQAANIHLKRS